MPEKEWVDMPRLIELLEQGADPDEISKELNVSSETVRTIVGYVGLRPFGPAFLKKSSFSEAA